MITKADLLRVSVRQVIRQRTFGVIFSIAIGITAFITLAVLGQEMRYNIGQDMVLMGGVNVVEVIMDDASHVGQPIREFYHETMDALRAVPTISTVSANTMFYQNFEFRIGTANHRISFAGVDQHFWITHAATIMAGRFFTAEDIDDKKRVCILGWEAAEKLFKSPDDAIGKLLTLGTEAFEVVGVVGGVMLGSNIRLGFLPYTIMLDRKWGGAKIRRLFIRAIAWEDIDSIVKEIPVIVKKHQSAPNLLIRTQSEQLKRIKNTFLFVEVLLWLGIVASLLLGGFGIWHGTFAAVRARTREVGLKKAMGGSDKDILGQFLTEALCKSIAGGIVGIIIGTLFVHIGSYALSSSISYPLLLLSSLGSIIFSAVIGVTGGIYPAMQASRMDVVTALRFE